MHRPGFLGRVTGVGQRYDGKGGNSDSFLRAGNNGLSCFCPLKRLTLSLGGDGHGHGDGEQQRIAGDWCGHDERCFN